MNWSVSSNQSWLTVSPLSGINTGTVTAAYTANTGTSARTASLTFTASGATGSPKTVQVTQAGQTVQPVMSVTPSLREVSAASGTTTFSVSNTGTGTMNWIVSSNASWLTVSPSSGINTGTVTAAYTANTGTSARTASLTFTASGAAGSPKTVQVTQAGQTVQPVMSVTPSLREVSAASGTTTFSVSNTGTGTMNWIVSSSQSWLTVSPLSGTNTGTVTASYTANTGTSARTAVLTFTATGATGSPKIVQVTQAGQIVTQGYLQVTINPSGAVTAGAKWTVAGSGIWRSSGDKAGLSAGTYTVEFNAVSGWTKPANQTVTVTSGQVAASTGTYILPTTCSVSGYVRDSNGVGISGVSIYFDKVGSVITDNSGYYTQSVKYGWIGLVTPSYKSGCTISPFNRYHNVYSNETNQNYTVSCPTYISVSGYVKDSKGIGVSGVTLTFSNSGGSTTTNTSGYYSHSVKCGWSGTVTPSKSGCTFAPSSKTYTNVTSNQSQNYTATCTCTATYIIFGSVKDSYGNGISGVTLTFSNSGGSLTTNANGYYSHSVKCGWSGTVTPSKSGCTFSTPSRSYTNVSSNQPDQNYTASCSCTVTYTVSGYVRDSYNTGISGVTLIFSNNGGSASTDASGYYSRSLSCGWTGTVTLSKSGYTFSPVNRSYTNLTSNQTNQNYTGTASCTSVSVSGYVKNSSGAGISGVILTFSNNGGSASTDTSGYYSRSLSCGWSGTVTLSKSGYTFTPANRSYTNLTSNQTSQSYTGTASCTAVSVSGYVKNSAGTGISGVTLTFSNNGGSASTDSSGYYSRSLSCGWSGTVTPSKSGYTFTPLNRSYTNLTSGQTNQNYTGTPVAVKPNLACYKVSTWSDRIVISNKMGTNTDDNPLYTTDELYVDIAYYNNSSVSMTTGFDVKIYLDGIYRITVKSGALEPSPKFGYAQDYYIGKLTEGNHTISVKIDPDNAIAESNESDNECSKTFTVKSGTLVVKDGGFEAGSPNPYWNESSILFYANISNDSDAAHSGDWLVWFAGGNEYGGSDSPSVSQDIIIPEAWNATLNFQLWIYNADVYGILMVYIDNEPVFTSYHTDDKFYWGWNEVTADVSSFADGMSHTLEFFAFISAEEGQTEFLVDDVSITVGY